MSTQPIHESSQLKDDSFENVLKGLESSSTGSQPQQPTHSEIKLPNQSSELRSGKRLSSSTSSSSRTKRSADHHQSEIEQISAPSSSPKRNSRARDDVNRNNDDNNGGNDDDDDVAAQQRSFRRQLEEDELKYGATHVIKLFVPVSLCMLMVVASVRSLTFYTKTNIYLPYTPYTDQTVDTTTRVWQSFANAFIVLLVVAFMTFVLIVFYKMRCYRLIHGWLLMSSIMLILMFVTGYTTEMLKLFNVPIDVITMYLIMWNVGLVGMISIHLTAPLFMQQTFLLIMSSMMALTFIKYIPDWSVWTVLGILSVWDVVAVLCPRGPLRILVETAQKRKEPIFPALIYSSGVAYVAPVIASTVLSLGTTTNSSNRASINEMEAASSTQSSNPVHVQIQTNPLDSERTESMNLTGGTGRSNESITYYASSRSSRLPEVNLQSGNLGPAASSGVPAIAISSTTQMIRSTDDEIETNSTCSAEDVGIKLGLGDFIFYSVLVGKASMYNDWNTTLACFVAILIGLCLTLFLLAIFNKALPALPISISFGLIFYFCTSIFVQPLADQYSMQNIFI